ncbi:MAG TPA: hypothetical protein VN428_17670 [Bryobacteraceae bacterium]|nr:hypothetical protein [Bryobacteraceae bacterium]
MTQPAVALMEAIDLETDLPAGYDRDRAAGPEEYGVPSTWDEHLDDAIEHIRRAIRCDTTRETEAAMSAAQEALGKAREMWGKVADRRHAEFLRSW